MKTIKPHFGIRMQDSRCGKPAFDQRRELRPGHPTATLTASPQHVKPEFLERRPELLQTLRVAGDRVVVAPPPKHTQYPGADLRQVQVHFPFQRVLQFTQLVAQLLDRGDAADGEVPFPCLPADVREAQKVERLRRSSTTLLSSLGRVASELERRKRFREPLIQTRPPCSCVATVFRVSLSLTLGSIKR